MALNFPNVPTLGEEFTVGGVTWVWDGTKWTVANLSTGLYLPLAGGALTGPVSGITASFSGNVEGGNFVGAGVDVQLATTGVGSIVLRPSGLFGNPAGQVSIQGNGAVNVNGSLAATGGVTASGNFVPATGVACGFSSKQGDISSVDGDNYWNYYWLQPNMGTYVNTTYVGNLTPVSDYRIKDNVAGLSAMWDKVKALRPISYTHKEFTPPSEMERSAESGKPFVAADSIEHWGFIAHDLQDTLIADAATAYKDAPNAIQSPNSMTLIAALTKALQEAMARIEALEARLATRH